MSLVAHSVTRRVMVVEALLLASLAVLIAALSSSFLLLFPMGVCSLVVAGLAHKSYRVDEQIDSISDAYAYRDWALPPHVEFVRRGLFRQLMSHWSGEFAVGLLIIGSGVNTFIIGLPDFSPALVALSGALILLGVYFIYRTTKHYENLLQMNAAIIRNWT